MAAPIIFNTIVNQRSSFVTSFQILADANTPLNLNDMTVNAKYKNNLMSSDAFAKDITVEIIDANTGLIELSLTPEQTSEMEHGRKYFYDCTSTSLDGFKTRLIEGYLKVDGGVS